MLSSGFSIYVQAVNKPARQRQPLSFEIDSVFQYQEGTLNDIDNYIWQIELQREKLPPFACCVGRHHIAFGFARAELSEPYVIVFDDKRPDASVTLNSESPTDKKISGIIHDDNPVADQKISVELAFKYHNELMKVDVPVSDSTDANGRPLKVFRYFVQNIPHIDKSDPDYTKDFFACKIKDEAGNTIPYKSTYNAFMAEGVQTFGFQNATVLMKKVSDIERIAIKRTSDATHGNKQHQLQSTPRNIARGKPLLTLEIVIITAKSLTLKWNPLPQRLSTGADTYIVMNGDNEIATTFDTTFTDRYFNKDSAARYKVLARGNDGMFYASNSLQFDPQKPPDVHRTPDSLSIEEAKQMLVRNGYFDSRLNKGGKGFSNDYQLQADGKVVYDNATGLWWQQSGSSDYLTYKDAQEYIKKLNREKFAGSGNWRLPTLKEAMSLMEPEELNDDLYIDPIFDKTQRWIWTSDKVAGSSRRWVVHFYDGSCGLSFVNLYSVYVFYVRAVHSR